MAKKVLTKAFIEKEYLKLSGIQDGIQNEIDRRGATMLGCLVVGPRLHALQKFFGYPKEEIRETLARLKRHRIVINGRLDVEWLEKNGGLAFLCDHLVIEGLLERTTYEKETAKKS